MIEPNDNLQTIHQPPSESATEASAPAASSRLQLPASRFPPAPARIPVSTYRLQFGPDLGFAQATALIPYLSSLGITDLYASPLLAPRPGSSHGYDLCDPSRLNPELGAEADFDLFREALRRHSLGLIADFVPNHMGNDPAANPWWRDLLANGPSSPYAHFFDVDWDPVKPELHNRILLPVLGDQYGAVLASGQLKIHYHDGAFSLRYWSLDLPMNLRRMRLLLRHGLDALTVQSGDDDPGLRELLSILFHLDHIPDYRETDPLTAAERIREIEVVRQRLHSLASTDSSIRGYIDASVAAFNTPEGANADYRLLHQLLEEQVYRLAYWRTAMHEINYRRFFDINELAAIRMEDPAVFDAAHHLVKRLAAEGLITGLRLDHVDGLYDPEDYFHRLAVELQAPAGALYIVAEKILSAEETLPQGWNAHGTTGYDFLNDANALFIDSGSAPWLRKFHARFAGESPPLADAIYESKKLIIATSMASELNVLAHELNRISEGDWRTRDFTLDSIQEALREVVACFPVYRTYVSDRGATSSDEKAIATAIARAIRRNPALETSIFEFIRGMLLPDRARFPNDDAWRRALRFAMKFQQYTGPVQAKGVEDTAFYRYGPLVSQNEVGGEPSRFGITPAEFHEANLRRANYWPMTMLCSTTHDTKRSEDARARLNVISEIPNQFRAWLSGAARANAGLKTILDGVPMPDRADEYLYYQTLLAAWPIDSPIDPGEPFVARMREYMAKATKEKKIHTSWVNESQDYDRAVADFVTRSLTGRRSARFRKHLSAFHTLLSRCGMLNSLSQLVLKIGSPGVPDFYQGTETWNFTLVDPDNRHAVDFGPLEQRLATIEPPHWDRAAHLRALLDQWTDGAIKTYVTARGLRLRRDWAGVFTGGSYEPLEVQGERKDHAIAFLRRSGRRIAIVAAGRFFATLGANNSWPVGDVWLDTAVRLPDGVSGSFTGLFNGRRHPRGRQLSCADLFRDAPFAIVTNRD